VFSSLRTDEHGTRLHGSSSSVSGGSAELEEEEMFGDMDIDESNVVMRSIPVRTRVVPCLLSAPLLVFLARIRCMRELVGMQSLGK